MSDCAGLRVTALAGGVGGAKLADGLARVLPPDCLTVIVNTGDDFDFLGLRICPDLDTVLYTLAGRSNPATGWGRADETFRALETLGELGGPTWFRLGDRDLGLHLERTRWLAAGRSLTDFTQHLREVWGVTANVLPMSADPIPTWVMTDEGELSFQEYFVRRQCRPQVRSFRFGEVAQARPAAGVLEALGAADLIVFCPSNPWVSIDPILAVPGVRAAIAAGAGRVVAVSPIVGGATLKGPAAKMYAELGIAPSALAVAQHYHGLLSGFVLDELDRAQAAAVAALGLPARVTQTVMKTPDDRTRLALEVVAFGMGGSGE
jgi:LPPG:FO 2-phospho-L-lactate transferase